MAGLRYRSSGRGQSLPKTKTLCALPRRPAARIGDRRLDAAIANSRQRFRNFRSAVRVRVLIEPEGLQSMAGAGPKFAASGATIGALSTRCKFEGYGFLQPSACAGRRRSDGPELTRKPYPKRNGDWPVDSCMPLASIARVRVRSIRYMPGFLFRAQASVRQAASQWWGRVLSQSATRRSSGWT
jgi:hypothetical protein